MANVKKGQSAAGFTRCAGPHCSGANWGRCGSPSSAGRR